MPVESLMNLPLKDIVQDIRSLEPFPSVATRVLELASDEEVVPSELIEIIQLDPGLTAKVLRLCNSALYGFQREISTLQEAGNLLGVRALVNLVLTSSANRYFRDYGQATGRSLDELWNTSITHAVASRLLAKKVAAHTPGLDGERAYTAGLLQSIGCLVLDRYYEDTRGKVLALAREGHSVIEAEKYALGVHHAELGARLAARWDLPAVLTDTIRHHHAPEKATVDPVLTSIVHLSETMAAHRLRPGDPDELSYEVSDAALELTGLSLEDFESIGVELRTEIGKCRELLAA